MLTRIPCVLMRGGTSKGPFFRVDDLPRDVETRDRVLLAAMGSPDARQIDGVGGADPLTSKVAIVGPSSRPGIDVEYLFAQVVVDEAKVDVTPNCGNMLSGVGPFAIETGLVKATHPETTVRIFMVNSGMAAEAIVQTPNGQVEYEGAARIDGVPGTSAPIPISFLDTEGSACGSLLPTGNVRDAIGGVPVTLIDNGMPVVIIAAESLGRTGYESKKDLDADAELKAKLESIRLEAGPLMNLGDVAKAVVPKMCLVAPPQHGGAVMTRCFIPHVCHSTLGVLAAVTIGTACVLPGSVAAPVAVLPQGKRKVLSVEHPTGEFSVALEIAGSDAAPKVARAALLRTARRLFEGNICVPSAVWDGRRNLAAAAA